MAKTFESSNKTISSGKNRGRKRHVQHLGLLYSLERGTENRLYSLGLTRKHLEKETIVLT